MRRPNKLDTFQLQTLLLIVSLLAKQILISVAVEGFLPVPVRSGFRLNHRNVKKNNGWQLPQPQHSSEWFFGNVKRHEYHNHLFSSTSSESNTDDLQLSNTSNNNKPLQGKVCVVTGASRGIGKGIAIELGAAGATVYVTGTSSIQNDRNELTSLRAAFSTNDDVGGPGTIEETANLVTNAGGRGIAVLCNHAHDDNVRALFKQVETEQGRLDVLVNNAFRVPPGGADGLLGNFWEQGPEGWDAMHTIGLRSHYVATSLAIPLMLKTRKLLKNDNEPKPLVAMISSYGGIVYTFNVAYGVGKAGVDRMAKDMHQELKSHGIAICSLYPGVVMTERMERVVDSGEWEEKFGVPYNNAETPAFTGRAVVALATDPNNMSKSGTVQVVAELAREYNFFDDDLQPQQQHNDDAEDASIKNSSSPTRQPPSIRSLKFLIPNYALDKSIRDKVPDFLIPDWKIPMSVMAGGRPDPDAKV